MSHESFSEQSFEFTHSLGPELDMLEYDQVQFELRRMKDRNRKRQEIVATYVFSEQSIRDVKLMGNGLRALR